MINMTFAEALLTAILECGKDDLKSIEDCEYCYDDILARIKEDRLDLSFNSYVVAIFKLGRAELIDALEDYRNEFLSELDDKWEDCTKYEQEDLAKEEEVIEKLDPLNDVSWFANYMTSTVYLRQYDKYMMFPKLAKIVEGVEDNMGFEFRPCP